MSKQLVSGKHRLRNTYWSLVGAASATILSVQPVMAETIWDRFSTIMRDIYGQLVGISTIVAVTVAAIALLVRMVSRNQRAVDEATSWLKRVVVTWIILSGFVSARKNPRKHMARGCGSHLCGVVYYLHLCSHRYSSDNSNTEKYTRVL